MHTPYDSSVTLFVSCTVPCYPHSAILMLGIQCKWDESILSYKGKAGRFCFLPPSYPVVSDIQVYPSLAVP